MKYIDGYYFPDSIGEKYDYFIRHRCDSLAALQYLDDADRGPVIQGGGHVGLCPGVLCHWFSSVYTFEPDPENYDCLLHNTRHHIESGQLHAFPSGLSSQSGWVDLVQSPVNTGGHYIGGEGTSPDAQKTHVTLMTVDSLELDECTAIFLDVEGHELEVLKGARETIERCSPLLMLEVKDHLKKGGCTQVQLEMYLTHLGYSKVGHKAHDSIYVRT